MMYFPKTQWLRARGSSPTNGLPIGGVRMRHTAVRYPAGQYVVDEAHTQGIESFWSMLKRGINSIYQHVSIKHLDRYVGEFAGRHNLRDSDLTT